MSILCLSLASLTLQHKSHNKLLHVHVHVQGQDQGFRVEVAESEGEDAETWEDAMDEMEDTWMKEPAGETS